MRPQPLLDTAAPMPERTAASRLRAPPARAPPRQPVLSSRASFLLSSLTLSFPHAEAAGAARHARARGAAPPWLLAPRRQGAHADEPRRIWAGAAPPSLPAPPRCN